MLRENLQDLYVFILVAREKSFTKAAALMGVTQPTLSQAIRGLEQRLGLRLLTRTTRSVSPTEAGERILSSIAPLLNGIEGELLNVLEMREKPTGTVRISSTDYATQTVLWPRLQWLMHDYPEVRIEIANDSNMTDIFSRGYDLGIRVGSQVEQDMIAMRIGPDFRFAVVGSSSYLSRKPAPTSLAELSAHECVNLRTNTHGAILPWTFEEEGRRVQVQVTGQWTFNNTYHKLDAAIAGYGLAHLPEDMARLHVEAGRLQWVLQPWWPHYVGLHAYYPSGKQMSRAMRLVLEALRWQAQETDSRAH